MAEPINQSGPENRVTDPQALAPEAGRTAPVPLPNEAYNFPPVQRRNGLDRHDLEVTVNAWQWAAATVKWLASGAFVIALWFLSSTWFNAPAKTSDLAAARSEQQVTNVELKASIDDLRKRSDRQERALVKIAEALGEVRANIAFMAGAASERLHSANSPPASPITPLGVYRRPRPPEVAWRANQE